MRALAGFIMRGRAQAALVALAGNLLPLISPATVGLVTLRRGAADGSLVLMWALLPLLASCFYSETSSALVLVSIAAVAVLVPVALILKISGSWQLTLLAAVVISVVTAMALLILFGEEIANFQSNLIAMMTGLETGSEAVTEAKPIGNAGFLAYVLALNAVISLLLSRWWQSELYNPGGFGREFRTLRLAAPVAGLLLGGMVFCLVMPKEYIVWAALLGLPLLFSGIGLIHCAVSMLSLGGHWLVAFYVALLLIGPMMSILVVMVGFIDSLMNLRPRLVARKSGQ